MTRVGRRLVWVRDAVGGQEVQERRISLLTGSESDGRLKTLRSGESLRTEGEEASHRLPRSSIVKNSKAH
jgi:hypothetical protein